MTVATKLHDKLTRALAPQALEIVDESAHHAGHGGARPEGESHFRVLVVSTAFTGLSRVERQRRIYEAVAEELAGPVHALALTALTPDEAASRGSR